MLDSRIAVAPLAPQAGVKRAEIVAIYGKGGIGKALLTFLYSEHMVSGTGNQLMAAGSKVTVVKAV